MGEKNQERKVAKDEGWLGRELGARLQHFVIDHKEKYKSMRDFLRTAVEEKLEKEKG